MIVVLTTICCRSHYIKLDLISLSKSELALPHSGQTRGFRQSYHVCAPARWTTLGVLFFLCRKYLNEDHMVALCALQTG